MKLSVNMSTDHVSTEHAIYGHFGPVLGGSEAILGLFWRGLEAILGLFWRVRRPF